MKQRAGGGRALVCAAAALLSPGGTAAAAPTCEFVIRRAAGATAAAVGEVALHPVGLAPEQARVEMLGAAGPVPSRILWARRGEPLTVLFDASGGDTFTARVSADGAAASDWTPRAGVILETRARPDGPAETLAQAQNLWRRSTNTFGRSVVAGIHDGIHRHGPAADLLSRYQGWFVAPADGRYGFATVSADASFLLVDSRLVASWPGWHGVEGGRHGQHDGFVELRRGVHSIEYWNVLNGTALAVSAAWQPPGKDRYAIMPASAFAPVAAFDVAGVRGGAATAFEWQVVRHAQAGREMLVGVRCRALGPRAGVLYRWSFDDGTTQEGHEVLHVFARCGLRQVTLAARAGERELAPTLQRVAVHPRWIQVAECPEPVYSELREAALKLTPAALAPADLAAMLQVAERVEDWNFAGVLAEAAFGRLAAFTGATAVVPYRLGFFFQRPWVLRYERVPVAWRAVLADTTAPADLRALAAVHLAGFLIHAGSDVAEGLRLLETSAPDGPLGDVERRLKTVFRADGLVLSGQREAAMALYRQAGTAVDRGDTAYEVRRRGRLENARDYLRRKEYGAAEETLRGLEWECPMERLELETGLLMAAVHRGRGELLMALGVCRRLERAAPADPRRPELLLTVAQLCRDMGRDAGVRAALADLWQNHPYSEAAAKAKDEFATKH